MAPVAPNGWISVDLGWIWVGYIQDGLLGPFVPTEIDPGGHLRQLEPILAVNDNFWVKTVILGPGMPLWP